ncbi:hypothetical protein [Planctomicrobium sp. SH527]|uniref:hypothetical protein n=1 Tax=Planctomicrobium sp. SH527 TaxID=3448123 RepID=UPI003F5BC084
MKKHNIINAVALSLAIYQPIFADGPNPSGSSIFLPPKTFVEEADDAMPARLQIANIVPPAIIDDEAAVPIDEVDNSNNSGEVGPNLNFEPSRRFGQAPTQQQRQLPPITFLRNQAVLMDKGDVQVDVGLVYTYNEADIPVVTPALLIDEAQIQQRNIFVPLTFRYGLSKNLQTSILVPLGYAHEQVTVPGQDIRSDSGPIGDVVVSLSYALPKHDQSASDFVWTNTLSIPTGDAPSLWIRPDAGLGRGYMEYGSSLLALQRYDPLIVFGSVGARYGFEDNFGGLKVTPGLAFDYRLGVGFGVNESITLSAQFIGSYETEIDVDGLSVPGSDRDVYAIRFAITKAEERVNIEPFVTFGLTQAASEAQFGIVWTYK